MKKKYHYISLQTGEVLPNLLSVIKTVFKDYKHYRIKNFKWSYSRKGF